MMRTLLCSTLLFLLAIAVLRPPAALAQQTTGTISGTATDESNAPLPGARVEIEIERNEA